MENKLSTSGIGEDLIRCIVQFGCTETHLKTLYEKTNAEIETAFADGDDTEALVQKLDEYREDILIITQMRREAMLKLHEMYPQGDLDAWCLVKHLGIGAYCAWECWQASDNDPELLYLALRANKAFVKAMTRFLGAEVNDCAACLSDFLKAKGEA